MTLWVRRQNPTSKNVEVHCTYGPTSFEVVEDISGARALWNSLGNVLREIDESETKE